MQAKPKFKVGDIVVLKRDPIPFSLTFRKITRVYDDTYYYDYGKNIRCTEGSSGWNVHSLEQSCELYYKKIRNNSLARALYKDKIHKEEGDWLWILP